MGDCCPRAGVGRADAGHPKGLKGEDKGLEIQRQMGFSPLKQDLETG